MQRSGEQAPRANDLSPDELQVVPSEWPVCEVTRKVCGARLLTRCLGGKTEFHGVPTRTCLAIGPDDSEKIDAITGQLQLL